MFTCLLMSLVLSKPKCALWVPGSPVGAHLPVSAQHSRVHYAAGCSAQNLSGWSHQAASKPPEKHGQRCTGKVHTHKNKTHMIDSVYFFVSTFASGCFFYSQAQMGSPLTRHTPRSPASWSSPVTSPTNTSQNTPSPR